jgi:hypothetical protein
LVVDSFAERSGNTSLGGDGSKLSSSLTNPAEHVGMQIGGGGGWRAAMGNGWMAGGGTTGGVGGDTLAQPTQSISSSAGISAGSLELASGFIFGFLLGGDAALFLAPVVLGCEARGAFGVGAVFLKLGGEFSVGPALAGQADGLHGGRGCEGQGRSDGRVGDQLLDG